ncbi:t106 [Tupaiid betaherpesvirus 1]|uniref:T106 n=1 Tax=Tupaiid herpesvirus 1 (strain 1) TaxID=10397 RepID=Q91TJ7_TUHV1|nr:t106 [Tupaiid betaherpesvirus 1]AAK57150.1 t106 [Tupaiid betaherpesvirus 1]
MESGFPSTSEAICEQVRGRAGGRTIEESSRSHPASLFFSLHRDRRRAATSRPSGKRHLADGGKTGGGRDPPTIPRRPTEDLEERARERPRPGPAGSGRPVDEARGRSRPTARVFSSPPSRPTGGQKISNVLRFFSARQM